MYTKMIKNVFEISVKMTNYWHLAKHVLTIELYWQLKWSLYASHCDATGVGWANPVGSYNCVRIPTMGHGWMLKSSTFPRVHAHFCYKIQCQNSPGSVLLNNAMSEFQRYRNVFYQDPQGLPIFPLLSGASHWLMHSIGVWLNYQPFQQRFVSIASWQSNK